MNNKDKIFFKRFEHSIIPNEKKKLMENPRYAIGVDQYDINVNAYCLMKYFNGTTEVILQKRIRDEDTFNIEVENLSKYFNAEILKF